MKLLGFLSIILAVGVVIPGPFSRAQETAAPAPNLPLYPLDVAVAQDGSAYIVDTNLHGVWKWQDGQLSVFFQGSSKYRTPLNAPRCVGIDTEGRLLVGDTSTRDIYRFTEGGEPVPITGGKIGIPMDLAVASDGTIYVADLELKMLLRIPAGTSEVERVAALNPRGVFVDSEDRVWVVSQDAKQLQIVQPDGQLEVVVDHRVFEFPHQVVVNSAGEAIVSDGYKKALWKIVRGEEPQLLVEGPPLQNPVGMSLVGNRPVVVDPRARSVFRLEEDGQLKVWFEISR